LLLSVNTAVTVGTVKEVSADIAKISLKIPIVALPGTRAGIARNFQGHWRLIGYGEIITK